MKKIYIMQTHSGTFPAKLIKFFTKNEYTHITLSLNKRMNKMYTFGRRKLNNPFDSGFIIESINGDFYKKFNNTYCKIYELDISYFNYFSLRSNLKKYEKNPQDYNYDIIGLITKAFNFNIKRKNRYVCSSFISELLQKSQIHTFQKPSKCVNPEDFNDLPYKVIYEGKLSEYDTKNI